MLSLSCDAMGEWTHLGMQRQGGEHQYPAVESPVTIVLYSDTLQGSI